MVLPKTAAIPDEATAGLASVAVRMPSHPLFRKLITLSGVPIAAPSANPFGYVSPTTALHVAKSLGGKIRHILDGGPLGDRARVDVIVDLRDPGRPAILRPGRSRAPRSPRFSGCPFQHTADRRAGRGGRIAPGQMPRHYSPRTPVVLHARISLRAAQAAPAEAWLFVSRPAGARAKNVFWLDAKGDLPRAARRLFAVLRRLDEGAFQRIHVERPMGGGLAEALRDRLTRAAKR